MENNHKVLEELFALSHGGMTHNTDRIKELASFLGNPQDKYQIVHIAGTNGKGSVCSLIASILQESGLNVGLYTSPHILDFAERIRINGTKISSSDIELLYSKIKVLAFDIGASFFEITTAMAFDYFAKNNVDIAIVETGLGGRLDSTNIVTPALTIITSIDIDHCNLLGNTIEEIAIEKSGIIKPNVPIILQETNSSVVKIVSDRAIELNAPLVDNNDIKLKYLGINDDFSMALEIERPDSCSNIITSSLLGKHQIKNIKTAISAADIISKTYSNITQTSIISGIQNVIKNTGLHFRIEQISAHPPVIVDISHNPQSISILVETIKEYRNGSSAGAPILLWNVIFGVMKDKNYRLMLEKLYSICKTLIIVEPPVDRAASNEDIRLVALEIGFSDIVFANSTSVAISMIRIGDIPTIICGSFYIMGDIVTEFGLSF